MKIKFFHGIKNRLRMRTKITSRIPTANISRKLDICHLLVFWVRSTTGHRKLVEKLLFFLGAFAKLRKMTISFFMSVRLFVRIKQLGTHWKDFLEIWCLGIFRKSVKKIQVLLKSEKNNE
jgi:hypothetical protein